MTSEERSNRSPPRTDGGERVDEEDGSDDAIDDSEVVRTAAEAAEDVLFSRFDTAEVSDFDVAVSFEDRVLDVDVWIDADGSADPDRVAEDAALAAQAAVDDLLE